MVAQKRADCILFILWLMILKVIKRNQCDQWSCITTLFLLQNVIYKMDHGWLGPEPHSEWKRSRWLVSSKKIFPATLQILCHKNNICDYVVTATWNSGFPEKLSLRSAWWLLDYALIATKKTFFGAFVVIQNCMH